MSQKWYRKTSVQTAIVSGIFVVVAAIISGFFDLFSRSGKTSATTTIYKDSTSLKDANFIKVPENKTSIADSSSVRKSKAPTQLIVPQDSNSRITKPELVKPQQPLSETFYEVTLLLPSRMKDAEILVDNELAKIIQSTIMQKVIRVREKDSNHTIIVRKGEFSCSKQMFIRQSGLVITLCE